MLNYQKIYKLMPGIICSMIILCNIALAQKFGKITDEEWALQPPAQYPEADAVIIFNNGEMEVTYEPFRIKIERHVRIKIFNKDGADDAMTVEIPHWKDDKIKGLKAHTITPDGKKKKVKDIFKKKSDDQTVITFTFPAVEDGSILEYKYRQTHLRFLFLDPWYFQGDVYTLASRFSMALYPGFTYNASKRNLPIGTNKPREEECNFMDVDGVKYVWEVNNMMPAKSEPYMGCRNDMIASLHLQLVGFRSTYTDISFSRSWSDIGEMVQGWLDGYVSRKSKRMIKELAASLAGDSLTDESRIREIYNFVRDEIETRDESEDDGNIGKLLERKYGTVTEKNLLLVKLLCGNGFKAYPLYIGTRGVHGAFNPRSKQLSQFNRMICYIENEKEGLVLDAGEKTASYPFLPSFDLIEGGLLIDGVDSRPVRLAHRIRKAGKGTVSKIMVQSDGSAVCSTTVCIRGYKIANYDEFLSGSFPSENIAEQFIDNDKIKYDVLAASSEYDMGGDSLWFKFVVELPEFAEMIDDNLFFSPFVVPVRSNPFISKRRYFPIDFKYVQSDNHSIIISIPAGWQFADLPLNIQKFISGGEFTRRIIKDDQILYIQTSLVIEKPVFASGEYTGLKELFEIMETSGTDQVVVSPGGNTSGVE